MTRRVALLLLGLALLLAACLQGTPTTSPTPYPSGARSATPEEAQLVARKFLAAWQGANYGRMWELISPADRASHDRAQFEELYRSFARLAQVSKITTSAGDPQPTALPPEARPPDLPPPSPTPTPTGSAPASSDGASPAASGAPSAAPSPALDPDAVLPGPVPGMEVPATVRATSAIFGEVQLHPTIVMAQGADGWQVRWSPALLFPELGEAGTLRLDRTLGARGEIRSADGTVFAITRDDGTRVYPQEWLAGQTIGYVSEVTAEDLQRLPAEDGYRAGDVIGRSGLEYGAEALLRGKPGFTLLAVPPEGEATPLYTRDAVPGATLTITLRPGLQAAAQAALSRHDDAATAVVDPKSGDIWALASAPAFNPNAMTLGTTLDGRALAAPSAGQRMNKAVLGAYPAGSSFKPFTLAAALKLGVAGPGTRMSCLGTWTYSGFTFHNYEDHSLGNSVDLLQAMAFSCNTTYMPLSIRVYEKDRTALTDLVAEFGFGKFTGVKHLPEESGILPDAAYFESHPRWDGAYRPYNGFDQVQLAIGQGSFLGTPLQLANAYAAIGNGGRVWVPRIVIDATLPDGTVVEHNDPTPARTVSVTPEQLAYVVESLKAVVNYPYGTAHGAFAGFGIQVAGKSGTAETGGPDPDALFPAFAPAADPQIAVSTILVTVPLGTGGSDSAPLVRQVMARYFSGG